MSRKLPKTITQEEFEKIFAVEKKKDFKLAMLLAFEAGMRISEVVGLFGKGSSIKIKPLQKEDVDLEAHSIKIQGAKGDKDRVVPLPRRFNQNALNMLPLTLQRRTLQRHIKELGKKVLGREISFHTLRHGFASHLAGSGRPIHEVQMLMGHSRLDTTGIYLHTNPRKAIEGARDVF